MQKEYDVITIFDICADLVMDLGATIPEFGRKEKIVSGYSLEMGGSGCIFACGSAKLGLKTTGVGYAGNDALGEIVVSTLKEAGVDTSHIRLGDAKTALTLCMIKPCGDRSLLTYTGDMDTVLGEWIGELLGRTRHFHVSGYYLMNSLQPVYPALLKKAKELGVSISLDTNWDPAEKWDGGIREILQYVDIFLPNERELISISGKNTIDEALKYVNKFVPLIVVKCGHWGAFSFQKGVVTRVKGITKNVVDTVGAGDSFDAGFIFAYLNGYSIEDCIKAGVFCGGESTASLGGTKGQPEHDELVKYLKSSQ